MRGGGRRGEGEGGRERGGKGGVLALAGTCNSPEVYTCIIILLIMYMYACSKSYHTIFNHNYMYNVR